MLKDQKIKLPWFISGGINEKNIKNAGSICNGPNTPMSVSDYTVGTNHVLPTYGSSKFSSGLNINEFIKV